MNSQQISVLVRDIAHKRFPEECESVSEEELAALHREHPAKLLDACYSNPVCLMAFLKNNEEEVKKKNHEILDMLDRELQKIRKLNAIPMNNVKSHKRMVFGLESPKKRRYRRYRRYQDDDDDDDDDDENGDGDGGAQDDPRYFSRLLEESESEVEADRDPSRLIRELQNIVDNTVDTNLMPTPAPQPELPIIPPEDFGFGDDEDVRDFFVEIQPSAAHIIPAIRAGVIKHADLPLVLPNLGVCLPEIDQIPENQRCEYVLSNADRVISQSGSVVSERPVNPAIFHQEPNLAEEGPRIQAEILEFLANPQENLQVSVIPSENSVNPPEQPENPPEQPEILEVAPELAELQPEQPEILEIAPKTPTFPKNPVNAPENLPGPSHSQAVPDQQDLPSQPLLSAELSPIRRSRSNQQPQNSRRSRDASSSSSYSFRTNRRPNYAQFLEEDDEARRPARRRGRERGGRRGLGRRRGNAGERINNHLNLIARPLEQQAEPTGEIQCGPVSRMNGWFNLISGNAQVPHIQAEIPQIQPEIPQIQPEIPQTNPQIDSVQAVNPEDPLIPGENQEMIPIQTERPEEPQVLAETDGNPPVQAQVPAAPMDVDEIQENITPNIARRIAEPDEGFLQNMIKRFAFAPPASSTPSNENILRRRTVAGSSRELISGPVHSTPIVQSSQDNVMRFRRTLAGPSTSPFMGTSRILNAGEDLGSGQVQQPEHPENENTSAPAQRGHPAPASRPAPAPARIQNVETSIKKRGLFGRESWISLKVAGRMMEVPVRTFQSTMIHFWINAFRVRSNVSVIEWANVKDYFNPDEPFIPFVMMNELATLKLQKMRWESETNFLVLPPN